MKMYNIWVDDMRKPPTEDWIWCRSVNQTKSLIKILENNNCQISSFSLDHDAGKYHKDGGDYIEILNWFELTGRRYNNILIHSMNPVGKERMKRVVEKLKNGRD